MKITATVVLLWCVGLFWKALAAVEEQELNALYDLYDSTNGDKWTYKSNWLNGDPCDNNWYGVNCADGHVAGLELQQNNLGGALPASFGNLTHMVEISLDCFNHIGGTIPASVGQLRETLVWTTADDPMTGTIPTEMCNMKAMQILHIGGMKLTGKIPDCLSFMADRNCGMSGNNFACPIPDWARLHCGAKC